MQSTPSTYIFDRAPMKYGSNQNDYHKRTRALIASCSKQIKETAKEEGALVKLFFRLIDEFSKERQAIARDHKTPQAEQFGCRRDTSGDKDFYHTILDQDYKEYNPKILNFLAEQMRSMSLDKKSSEKKYKKLEETHLGRLSSYEIEIFEMEELKNKNWICALKPNQLPNDFPRHLFEKRANGGLDSNELQALKKALKQLKEKDGEFYKRFKMGSYFSEIQKEFPSPIVIPLSNGSTTFQGKEENLKSFLVLGTARFSVQG